MIKNRSTPPRSGTTGRRVRLKPHNPFDLIRLIAHSQSDARKAMAELVQNSFDAEATEVTITRRKRRGDIALSILDNGRGVFPEIEREGALERLATNIGHSFKLNLSAAERQKQMVLGKYGIGLLGFWSIGRELELRSRVKGSPIWSLRLVRDEPVAEVRRLPQGRFNFDGDTWTEVIIHGLHAGVLRQLSGRRLGEYLGSELRGQLLSREVKLKMVDRLARGASLKEFLVVPRRFQGSPIRELREICIPGHAAATAELYLLAGPGNAPGVVALSSGGTVVSEDLGTVDGYGLDPAVWSSGGIEGVIDFPDLEAAPSTRRDFVRNAAADRLFEALKGVEVGLRKILAEHQEKRELEEDQNLAHEIRRIFRPLTENLPQYDFFDIQDADGRESERHADQRGARLGRAGVEPQVPAVPQGEPGSEVVELGDEPEPPPELLSPGPLAGVRIVPRKCRLLPGATKLLAARATDQRGRTISEGIEFTWILRAGGGVLKGDGGRAEFTAAAELGAVRIAVRAGDGERSEEAEAELEVVEKLRGENPDAGIPDPKRVFDPEGDWRSRVISRRWEYNAAHPDYQAVAADSRRRLRYLTHLFAKEIVLRNYGDPSQERLLERMVEVLTYIKRGSY
jgi:hypothetical protein